MSEYTDYTERFAEFEKMRREEKYATRKTVALATVIPTATSIGLAVHQYAEKTATALTSIPVYAQIPVVAPQQTGIIADASLTAITTILDPIINLLVAISFPIASVIVVCSFFLIMLGNQEKAFDMMMKAGLGYILIQLSPMLLNILKSVGSLL